MNDPDPFEAKLRSLPLRPLPPEWRDEILAHASAPRPVQATKPAAKGPPRWLLCSWGAGIAATVALHLTQLPQPEQGNFTPSHVGAPSPSLKRHAELIEAWLAQHESNPAYPKP